MAPRIKICCIGSVAEADMAVRHGAAAVGLVSAMPSGPGVIPEETIALIARAVPPGVSSFLLTSQTTVAAISAQHRRCLTTAVQICDRLPPGTHAVLREALPGTKLVQVVHVGGEESVAEAVALAPHVDALLLDSGNQALAVKELGGTGRRHDWSVSRTIVEAVPVPVWLAGGLTADNAAEAVATVRPFGLDVCSGVRAAGVLDEGRLAAFMRAAGQ
jgi:phosphoribosylanthranilate isomerase